MNLIKGYSELKADVHKATESKVKLYDHYSYKNKIKQITKFMKNIK